MKLSDQTIETILVRLNSTVGPDFCREVLRDALKPDLFWDANDPEQGGLSPEDMADWVGENEVRIECMTAISLPNQWFACHYEEENGWICRPCADENQAKRRVEEAQKRRLEAKKSENDPYTSVETELIGTVSIG